jgi:hypothetical protein
MAEFEAAQVSDRGGWWRCGGRDLAAVPRWSPIVELLDALAELVAIALVAAVVAEHVTRDPARPGALVVVAEPAPLDLDVLAAVSGSGGVPAPRRWSPSRCRGGGADRGPRHRRGPGLKQMRSTTLQLRNPEHLG